MSARAWKPGDVAMVTVDGETCRAMRQDANWSSHDSDPLWTTEHRVQGVFDHYDRRDEVTNARPLVVIDPENREQVERLRAHLEGTSFSPWACGAHTCLQQALRSLAADPKPDEPQGLGAVVEDAEGNRWVRGDDDLWWRKSIAVHWVDVDAVRELAPGWSE